MGLSSCTTTGVCTQSARRHTGMVGINWHPRPIRLD
jgi:hypothetical protein